MLPKPKELATMVCKVTDTMFGISFDLATDGEDALPWRDNPPPYTTTMVPIRGTQPTTVVIAADEEGGKKLSAAMLSCTPAEMSAAMVKDSLSELANIVAGQVRATLGGDHVLGLPKVLPEHTAPQGATFNDWHAATLSHQHMSITVYVALAPQIL